MRKFNLYKTVTLATLILSTSLITEAHMLNTHRYGADGQTGIDLKFPYGQAPKGDVSSGLPEQNIFLPPEMYLGSWAMIEAAKLDSDHNQLPGFLKNNVAYAFGTATGEQFGLKSIHDDPDPQRYPHCEQGCQQTLGYCFALKLPNKKNGPQYMIYQSIETWGGTNQWDFDMAGGGFGSDEGHCPSIFPGMKGKDWEPAINTEGGNCSKYFKKLDTSSKYNVTYNGIDHDGNKTLRDSCKWAAENDFNNDSMASQTNIPVVPVTCPQALTQVSGLRLKNQEKIGKADIIKLQNLTDKDFQNTQYSIDENTQNQDCSTPTGGFSGNIQYDTVDNYKAVISVDQYGPYFMK